MEQPPPTIAVLPSEILIQVLAHFPTRQLLALATLSRRFHGLVGRLHYSRLVDAASLRDHVLVLECYHPSVKFSTPTLHCDYLGTDGIDDIGHDASLTDLRALYSRFRPTCAPTTDRLSVWPTRRPSTTSITGAGGVLSHDLLLDSGEPFSQLCTQASIIKIDPDRKLFVSIASVTEGVIRVWRKWLRAQAQLSSASSTTSTTHTQVTSASGKSQRERADNDDGDDDDDDDDDSHSVVLWTDVLTENAGIKFRVVEKDVKESSVLLAGPNDEPPVAYTLEYEELLVRTNALLLSLERSLAQQVTHAGKSMVFTSQ
ncbi:F-box-like domain-containing protein [Microdochium nivale]|nr:F-box-like domain-containing protein [Microdochium nivale]